MTHVLVTLSAGVGLCVSYGSLSSQHSGVFFCRYGGKFGVQKDRVDKSAVDASYKEKLATHASQMDAAKGYGGKYGVDKDRVDKVCNNALVKRLLQWFKRSASAFKFEKTCFAFFSVRNRLELQVWSFETPVASWCQQRIWRKVWCSRGKCR